jgi:hypothetical protein
MTTPAEPRACRELCPLRWAGLQSAAANPNCIGELAETTMDTTPGDTKDTIHEPILNLVDRAHALELAAIPPRHCSASAFAHERV